MAYILSNLGFEYKKDTPVLLVRELTIHKGAVTFVIGKSGIGKSTLIEGLGMMNNLVIRGKTNLNFEFTFKDQDDVVFDLSTLWEAGQEKLPSFRSKYLSFIFQETNLLPHYSAGMNLVLVGMISGKSFKESVAKSIEYLIKFGLAKDSNEAKEVFDRNVSEFSGGQKQRLAFIRAVISDHEVLICDEPTGNLDPGNAETIMKHIQTHIKKENKTAIVVSHDYALAESYADRVIPIVPTTIENSRQYEIGYIDDTHGFASIDGKSWRSDHDGHGLAFHQIAEKTEKVVPLSNLLTV